MKTREMIISVTGMQQTAGGPDSQELNTVGQYGFEGGEFLITWEGTSLNGMAGTTTTMRVYPDHAVMKRTGTTNAEMEFVPGVKKHFLYQTPAGVLGLSVLTYRVRHDLSLRGGSLFIDYDLENNGIAVSRNRLLIKVTEPKKSHIGDISWPT